MIAPEKGCPTLSVTLTATWPGAESNLQGEWCAWIHLKSIAESVGASESSCNQIGAGRHSLNVDAIRHRRNVRQSELSVVVHLSIGVADRKIVLGVQTHAKPVHLEVCRRSSFQIDLPWNFHAGTNREIDSLNARRGRHRDGCAWNRPDSVPVESR